MFKSSYLLSSLVLAAAALCAQSVQAQVVATIDAPGVQTSSVTGITTETFDGFSPGIYTTLVSAIGTYTSPGLAIAPANQFGGAGGTGNYFAIGGESGQLTATLKLNGDQGYFGFWYSAGDPENQIQLYENSTLEYTLNTAGLINFINQQPNVAAYYGNPNNGEDSGEPFAYVNFFGTNGTVFNTVVFNNASLGSGFESDNHSVGPASPVTGIPIGAPEPSALLLALTGGLTGATCLRRKRAH